MADSPAATDEIPSLKSFYQALEEIVLTEEDPKGPEGISQDAFYQLFAYLRSSRRLLDSETVARLLEGDPRPLVFGLASHLLMASVQSSPRNSRRLL